MSASTSTTLPKHLLAGDVTPQAPAKIRRPQVAKHQPRTEAPAFNPALVSRTLSPNA